MLIEAKLFNAFKTVLVALNLHYAYTLGRWTIRALVLFLRRKLGFAKATVLHRKLQGQVAAEAPKPAAIGECPNEGYAPPPLTSTDMLSRLRSR